MNVVRPMRRVKEVLPLVLAKLTCTWIAFWVCKHHLSCGVSSGFRMAVPPSPPDAFAEVKTLFLKVVPTSCQVERRC